MKHNGRAANNNNMSLSHQDTSPWTEAFAMHCHTEDSAGTANGHMQSMDDEQQPTHDALVNIYNPDE